jgi:putative transposase
LPLLANDRIKRAFVDHLSLVKNALGFELYAWVVMPEHVHLLIQTGTPKLIMADVLRRLKSPFAARVLARWRTLDAPILTRITGTDGKQRFWQPGGGYDRNLVTEHEWIEKIDYIHQNPVRRGLVSEPSQWAWSSARWYAGQREGGPTIDPLW